MEIPKNQLKKLPYTYKKKITLIFFVTSLLLFLLALLYIKMQTKLYRTESEFSISWDNKEIENIAKKNIKTELFSNIKTFLYSDTFFIVVLKDINSISSDSKLNEINDKLIRLKDRIIIDEIYDYCKGFGYNISIISTEPEKGTRLVNSITNNMKKFLIKEMLFISDIRRNNILEILKKNKENTLESQLIEKDLSKEYIYLNLLFSKYPPLIEVKQSSIPIKPIYPDVFQSLLGSIVISIFIGFIFIVSLIFDKFCKINNISLFETKKESLTKKHE